MSAGNDEKTKSMSLAFSTDFTSMFSTVISPISLGISDSKIQLQALRYFFDAERSEAASTSTLNQGCLLRSWTNLCPTAPVAPKMATLRFKRHSPPREETQLPIKDFTFPSFLARRRFFDTSVSSLCSWIVFSGGCHTTLRTLACLSLLSTLLFFGLWKGIF